MPVCTTVLPVVKADLCDPDIFFGEISMLMFTRLGDGLTDWTDDGEWTTRKSNTTTGTSALPTSGLASIRQLFGIGSIGKAERTEIKLPRRTKGYTAPKYNFTFLVTDTGDANMAFSRALPLGGQVYTAWFGTEQRLFGGNGGVTMTVISDPTIPDSADDIMRLELTLSFEGAFPEVTDNVLV